MTLNRGDGTGARSRGGKAFQLIRVRVRTRANNSSKGGYILVGNIGGSAVRAIRNNGQGCRHGGVGARTKTLGRCNFVNSSGLFRAARMIQSRIQFRQLCAIAYLPIVESLFQGIESMRLIRETELLFFFLFVIHSCFYRVLTFDEDTILAINQRRNRRYRAVSRGWIVSSYE